MKNHNILGRHTDDAAGEPLVLSSRVEESGGGPATAFVEFQPAIIDSHELQLTTVGRATGHESSRPVWFVRRDQTLYLIPGDGYQSQWYKNIVKSHTFRLSGGGATQSVSGTPVTDSNDVVRIADAFREKYGRMRVGAYYPTIEVALEVHAVA